MHDNISCVIVQNKCYGCNQMLLKNKFQHYLKQTLGIEVKISSYPDEKRFPLYIAEIYEFYAVSIYYCNFILVIDNHVDKQTPAKIRKHMDFVFEKTGLEAIYLCEAITSFDRKRLIEQKVAFVVPDNQMYLPMVKIDLREHFLNLRKNKVNKLSPSTQTILLRALYEKEIEYFTTKMLAEKHDYSMMTLNRAFDELEALGLAEVFHEGRERVLRFLYKGRNLWDSALEFMRNPVKRRVYVIDDVNYQDWPRAGLSALANYTMLAEPGERVFAMSSENFKELIKTGKIIQRKRQEGDCIQIEVWQYQPELFCENNLADPLSVYLSLLEENDERVEIALDSILENFKW